MIRLWRNAWNEFIPFLDYDTEIRKVICSTNAIESLNARYRRAGAGTRALSQRAGRAEVPVPCDPQPRPDRDRPHPVDDALEARD
jgi:putative transposase